MRWVHDETGLVADLPTASGYLRWTDAGIERCPICDNRHPLTDIPSSDPDVHDPAYHVAHAYREE
jgi:hypothetical protein